MALFACVICFQAPIGPAQISGGSSKEWRTMADVFPSVAIDTLYPSCPSVITSDPVHNVSTSPCGRPNFTTPGAPSRFSTTRMFCEDGVQQIQLAEAFMLGVMFLAAPPEAGIMKTS